jgi:tetratricopeptide (TPR) repeat protein
MAIRSQIFSIPSLLRTLFFVAIAVGSFVVIDSILASTERRETGLEAARFYREGQSLMLQHRYSEAAESFRLAIDNSRENRDYPLALAEALLDAGRLEEASATLAELLKTDPMAGRPNLAMARVLEKQGQNDEAAFSYHRAIYGQWKEDAAGNQLRARFELADFLARHNLKGELLAELLPLQEQAPSDAATQEKIASQYLLAGSPIRAAAVFREQVRVHPQDPVAREGLANADFARGDYNAARDDFAATLRLRPDGAKARAGLDLTNQILNLDPLQRGLGNAERYQRSVRILQAVVDQTGKCLPATPDPDTASLVTAVQTAVKRRVSAGSQSDSVEANLELANKLWRAERKNCTSPLEPADQALQLVLAKAVQ